MREALDRPLEQLRERGLEALGRELRLERAVVLRLVGVDRDVGAVALVARARMRDLAQHHPAGHVSIISIWDGTWSRGR